MSVYSGAFREPTLKRWKSTSLQGENFHVVLYLECPLIDVPFYVQQKMNTTWEGMYNIQQEATHVQHEAIYVHEITFVCTAWDYIHTYNVSLLLHNSAYICTTQGYISSTVVVMLHTFLLTMCTVRLFKLSKVNKC